jgi:hypothetical protein
VVNVVGCQFYFQGFDNPVVELLAVALQVFRTPFF